MVNDALLWQKLLDTADAVGLDVTVYGEPHRRLVRHVADFLRRPAPDLAANAQPMQPLQRLLKLTRPARDAAAVTPVEPVILYGPPGTGKTVFLSLLDIVLRRDFSLADPIEPPFHKAGSNGRARTLDIPKRELCGIPLSLLSVHNWSKLLHLHAWDVSKHAFDRTALEQFLRQTIAPMRVIFADEVEMAGYSPTLPDLAASGVLVVGSSNQSEFAQLVERDLPPRLIFVGGNDMRAGTPDDAVVGPDQPASELFDQVAAQPASTFGRLPYHVLQRARCVFLLVDFRSAVRAPLLETEWSYFLRSEWRDQQSPTSRDVVMMLDDFTLDALTTDYNAVIRFTILLDTIEQTGAGLLLRNLETTPSLSQADLDDMKRTLEQARGVSERIKTKTVAGIDRCVSRIGAAGRRAQRLLDAAS